MVTQAAAAEVTLAAAAEMVGLAVHGVAAVAAVLTTLARTNLTLLVQVTRTSALVFMELYQFKFYKSSENIKWVCHESNA